MQSYRTVVKGTQTASLYGFPTANVECAVEQPSGVFFGTVVYESVSYPSVIYTGISNQYLVECHLLDFDRDLYGQCIQFERLCKIRDDKTFDTLDTTIFTIHLDIKVVRILSQMFELSNVAISFSGGKEASLLLHLAEMLNITFSLVHFKPRHCTLSEYMSIHKNVVIVEYDDCMEGAVKSTDGLCSNYIIGVRRDDLPDRPIKYTSDWLTKSRVCTPLYELSYRDIWNLIEHLGVDVSPLYSLGYSSVGYRTKPNRLLAKFDGSGFKHARNLLCDWTER